MSIKQVPDNLLYASWGRAGMERSRLGQSRSRCVLSMVEVTGEAHVSCSSWTLAWPPFLNLPSPKALSLLQPRFFIYFHKDKKQSVTPKQNFPAIKGNLQKIYIYKASVHGYRTSQMFLFFVYANCWWIHR